MVIRDEIRTVKIKWTKVSFFYFGKITRKIVREEEKKRGRPSAKRNYG